MRAMKTHFEDRTAYSILAVQMPQCFTDLDEAFDRRFGDFRESLSDPLVTLAENICRRAGDVELYAWHIHQAKGDANVHKAATLTGSYLVAFFGACKSLLDAGSITLTELYKLPLPEKEQDFGKPKFWTELGKSSQALYDRYETLHSWMRDVIQWRDSSVHRVTPLVMLHAQRNSAGISVGKYVVKWVSEVDMKMPQFVKVFDRVPWADPLDLYDQWKPHLDRLCEELCKDIRASF